MERQLAELASAEGVQIDRVRGRTVEWIVLRAPICAAGEMDPQLVLERNGRLALASIALAAGLYWLRIALPADSSELSDPARAIALVREAANSLVPRRAQIATPAFDHYAT